MKRYSSLLPALLLALFAALAPTMSFAEETAHERRIRLATELVQKMAARDDASDLASVVKRAKGIAIIPKMTKAGFIVGAQTGEGLILLKNGDKWTGPSFAGISGASVGLQIGAQSVGLVLVITNNDGILAFTGGNSFKLGADVAGAAGPAGRDASAATDGRSEASIYSYSISKGLYAGVSLEGCVINQNRDANKAYWRRDITPKQALAEPASDKRIAKLAASLNQLVKLAN